MDSLGSFFQKGQGLMSLLPNSDQFWGPSSLHSNRYQL
jgi:hypothetical protein